MNSYLIIKPVSREDTEQRREAIVEAAQQQMSLVYIKMAQQRKELNSLLLPPPVKTKLAFGFAGSATASAVLGVIDVPLEYIALTGTVLFAQEFVTGIFSNMYNRYQHSSKLKALDAQEKSLLQEIGSRTVQKLDDL